MEKRTFYIIHSDYIQQGITFNSSNRYTDDQELAGQRCGESLQAMKAGNADLLTNDRYTTQESSKDGSKYFICFCKAHPMASNFSVEMKTAELE